MPSHVGTSQAEAVSLARVFWENFRDLAAAERIEQIREQIKAFSPVSEAFSFELVEQGSAASGEGMSSANYVEPGTPKTLIDAWNATKLVGLMVLKKDEFCRAAVPVEVQSAAVDFKACAYATEGDDKCPHSSHVGLRVKRINPPAGMFIVAIPAGFNDRGQVSVVFSRPILEESAFLHLPLGSDGFDALLKYRFERRVWKFLLQHFPGPMVFVSRSPSAVQDVAAPPPLKNEGDLPVQTESLMRPLFLATSGLEEVTAAPILSPSAGGAGVPQTYQQTIVEQLPKAEETPLYDGWSSDNNSWNEDHKSIASSRRTYPSRFPVRQEHQTSRSQASEGSRRSQREFTSSSIPWAKFAQQQRRTSDESWARVNTVHRNVDSQDRIISDLRDRVQAMEMEAQDRDKKLLEVFEALAEQINDEKEKNARLTKELRDLAKDVGDMDPARSLSDRELFSLSRKVYDQIDWSNFVTKRETEDLRKASALQTSLVAKVDAVEKELIDPAGMMSTITTRVAALEASKSATSIELAGYVFRDEASV